MSAAEAEPQEAEVKPLSPAAVKRKRAEQFGRRMFEFALILLPDWSPKDEDRSPNEFADLMYELALDYADNPPTEEVHLRRVSEAARILPITKDAVPHMADRLRQELLRIMAAPIT